MGVDGQCDGQLMHVYNQWDLLFIFALVKGTLCPMVSDAKVGQQDYGSLQ